MNYCDNVKNGEWATRSAVNYAIRTREHYPILRGKLKGYIFGYVDTKPDYLNQDNIVIALKVLQHLPHASPNRVTAPNRPNLITNITG